MNVHEQNREIVRRYLDAWERFDLDALDGIIAPDVIDHMAYEGQQTGIEGYRQFFTMWRDAFPDLHTDIHDTIVDDDKVAVRWTATGTHRGEYDGVAPTGKRVSFSAISLMRIENGRIVEEWVNQDTLGLLQQLGAVEAS